jgi:hypothetical protein
VEPLVFLEMKSAKASNLEKPAVLQLFRAFRQAERSVHFALSSPKLWTAFIAYYDAAKLARLREQICLLNKACAGSQDRRRDAPKLASGALSILRAAGRLLANRLKSHWAFSIEEISYFVATLERLLEIAVTPRQPPVDELIAVRFDCLKCQWIIERELIGIRELKEARRVEHFCQSDYVNSGAIQAPRASSA